MRLWKVVVLLNLALLLGAGWGYLWWGREAARLARELAAARAAAPAAGGAAELQGRGVVRAVLPEINVVVLTHDEIPGYMPAMTMGFRAATPNVYAAVAIGDAVRFTLRGVGASMTLTAIEKLSP
jgi:Cu/Ag efflux protein CusF